MEVEGKVYSTYYRKGKLSGAEHQPTSSVLGNQKDLWEQYKQYHAAAAGQICDRFTDRQMDKYSGSVSLLNLIKAVVRSPQKGINLTIRDQRYTYGMCVVCTVPVRNMCG